MKISIIIPVYNVERYLRECIESVLLQSYSNIEILLVNDGSTDKSKEICIEYEEQYSFIHLINKQNGGLSDARNVGILRATGDYLIFLDSDDYWEADFLADLVQTIRQKDNMDYIFFRYKIYYQQRKIYEVPPFSIERDQLQGKYGKDCLAYILENNKDFKWFAWNGIVKRDFILKNNLFFIKDRKYEDALWTPHLFLKSETIDFYDYPIYIYRNEREGQITLNHSFQTLKDSIFVATSWDKLLTNLPIEESLKEKLMRNFIERYYYAIKFAGFLTRNERNEIVSILRGNRALLKYKSTFFHAISSKSIKMVGFQLTIQIIKILLKLRRE